jgi:hypothetical protein
VIPDYEVDLISCRQLQLGQFRRREAWTFIPRFGDEARHRRIFGLSFSLVDVEESRIRGTALSGNCLLEIAILSFTIGDTEAEEARRRFVEPVAYRLFRGSHVVRRGSESRCGNDQEKRAQGESREKGRRGFHARIHLLESSTHRSRQVSLVFDRVNYSISK